MTIMVEHRFASQPVVVKADGGNEHAIGAIRAAPPRTRARGWAGLALIDDQDDCSAVGEANHQALSGRAAAVTHHGGAGATTAGRGRRTRHWTPCAHEELWAGRGGTL